MNASKDSSSKLRDVHTDLKEAIFINKERKPESSDEKSSNLVSVCTEIMRRHESINRRDTSREVEYYAGQRSCQLSFGCYVVRK